MNNAYLFIVKVQMGLQSLIPWVPSQGDLLAEDWGVLAEVGAAREETRLFGYTNERGQNVYLESAFGGNQYLKRNPGKDKVIIQ